MARHSQSSEARVELATDCRFLRILIEDRGVGFDPSEVTGNGFGLEVLRARAVTLGGCLTIDSASGQGTRVVAEIPLRENLW